jgi:hypothetical protein
MSSVWTHLSKHGGPASCLSRTLDSGLLTTVQSTLRIQLTARTSRVLERGRDTGWLWIKYPIEHDMGEQPHFLLTPSSMSVASVVDLATIHVVATSKLVTCAL